MRRELLDYEELNRAVRKLLENFKLHGVVLFGSRTRSYYKP